MRYAYSKNEQGPDAGASAPAGTTGAGGVQVKDAAFRELVTSVRQAGRVRRGRLRAGRTTVFRPTDVQAVRAKLGASQAEFALMIGVSVATLRNWERGRRTPHGPALALLRLAAKNPKAVAEALHGKPGAA
jgi:putative transcriptional regulator